MKHNRAAVFAAYTMVLYMGLVPLLDTAVGVWPARIGAVEWRYGTVGIVADALMVPLLGVAVGVGVALTLGHRRIIRALAIVAGSGAVLTIVVLLLFVLDAVEIRADLTDAGRLPYDVATATSLAKMMIVIVFGLAVSKGGWSASRGRIVRPKAPTPGTIVMGDIGAEAAAPPSP